MPQRPNGKHCAAATRNLFGNVSKLILRARFTKCAGEAKRNTHTLTALAFLGLYDAQFCWKVTKCAFDYDKMLSWCMLYLIMAVCVLQSCQIKAMHLSV